MTRLATVPTLAYPLSQAEVGARVQVAELRGGEAFARRMIELGLNVGSELTVRQRQGAALVVSRGEARLALGAGLAHRVWVRPLAS